MVAKIVIKYAEDVKAYKLLEKPVKLHGGILQLRPGQSEMGYGAKITTDRMLQFDGESKTYRVYATCYGNASSQWIMKDGEKLHIRG